MSFCRVTLKPINRGGFSPAGLRALTGHQARMPHRLPFTRREVIRHRAEEAQRISISGVQDKVSLRLDRGAFTQVTTGGTHILKPIPGLTSLRHVEAVPANEHLTMQIAGQVFGIPVAACALVELADGEPAYLVRRFDRDAYGTKRLQEDFCQLANRSEATHGRNYKYDSTQEETGRILRRFCPAYAVQVEDLFRRHVFNYVFSNGDAHLKNFSLCQSSFGDHLLSPAYDLLCTSLHLPDDTRCALDLFENTETEFFQINGFYGRADFVLLAERFGVDSKRAAAIVDEFHTSVSKTETLVSHSFLPDDLQREYVHRMFDRLRALS
ncbi:MAG: HipA domain-containing protein [Kiritimatiellia bacterium]